MATVSEAARGRETFRYAAPQLMNLSYQTGPTLQSSAHLTSSDTVLTGLAQLAALRFNASRAIISLFDQSWQYVVAEATPQGPLSPSTLCRQGSDRLLLCGLAVPRSVSMCEHVLQNTLGASQPTDPRSLPVSVISDLSEELRLSENPYFKDWPHRFYAATPLRTARGINIGVLSVYGDDARKELDEASIALMQDLSQSVMTYLGAIRSRDGHRRADRMVRGVGSFVEGQASLAGWQEGPNVDSFKDDFRLEGSLNAKQQTLQEKQRVEVDSPDGSLNGILDTETPSSPSVETNTTLSRRLEAVVIVDSPKPEENLEMSNLKHILSKAANVLRESVEVEGVLFLDAAISSFGGDVTRTDNMHGTESSSSDEGRAFQSSFAQDAPCRVLGFSDSLRSSVDGAPGSTVIPEKYLSKLLRRYPHGKIFNFDGNGSLQSSDSSDDASSVPLTPSPSTQVSQPENARPQPVRSKSWSRKNDGTNIISLFPGARSVAFFPVWDAHRQRWLAGGFAYTKTATRTFTVEGELSYLIAFASIATAEVQRAREMLLNKTKTDLLGSLSHELRSPLHGIVLGAELLQDTEMDVFQKDVLNSIENCSRTLVDTIDHLLDWTKINKFKTSTTDRRNSIRGKRGVSSSNDVSIETGMMSITSDVEVDVVAEQVVESVFAGHCFQTQSVTRLVDGQGSQDTDMDAMRRLDSTKAIEALGIRGRTGQIQVVLGDVVVSLDINANSRWAFTTQPGAIRRILLNVLGNALKFTARGSVKITLHQEPLAGKPHNKRMVCFTVADTGCGMSQEFLHHRLFRPFSQVDSLTPGTGLGLSLVHKIVGAMDGSIHVRSKLGVGSTVVVKVPLRKTLPPTPGGSLPTDTQAEFRAQVCELKGLRVAITGYSAVEGIPSTDVAMQALTDEHAMLVKVCKEWLHMHVIEPSEANQLLPDLILCGAHHLDQLVARDHTSTPTVAICRSALAARQLSTSPRFMRKDGVGVVDFISQPLGPRKLAKILLQCFKRWSKLQESALSTQVPSEFDVAETASPTDTSKTSPDVGPEYLPEPDVEPNGVVDDHAAELPPSSPKGPTEPWSISTEQQPIELQRTEPQHMELEQFPSEGSTPRGKTGSPVVPVARYLLVEDNAINLKILTVYMKKLGRVYETASNGLEALETFKKGNGQFKCILMDISMPVMDGFESARHIRAFERDKQLPRCAIYALTGLASDDAQQEAFASGLDLFLTKPVKLAELSQIIGRGTRDDQRGTPDMI
ncbi:hypothetical protein JX265_009519 [Neoarthrinium moseri]|uniref:histidine kinase n=1 Tax=Neoarthrinium moseri TaxID=1658444 RepID=A0A9Q0AMI2_9PEZI|nr:hypothetical protein JX265_009519 [Neoarthrinium moseri]